LFWLYNSFLFFNEKHGFKLVSSSFSWRHTRLQAKRRNHTVLSWSTKKKKKNPKERKKNEERSN